MMMVQHTNYTRDLSRVVSLTTIKLWIQMLNKSGSINLSHSPNPLSTHSSNKSQYRRTRISES